MKSVSTLVYFNGDMIPLYEGILFECPSGPQFVIISDHMLLDALRKTIIDTIRGSEYYLIFFIVNQFFISDDCVEYNCMKVKRSDDVGKMFFIFLEFSSKCPIELNANFSRSSDEILALLCKPMKQRSIC